MIGFDAIPERVPSVDAAEVDCVARAALHAARHGEPRSIREAAMQGILDDDICEMLLDVTAAAARGEVVGIGIALIGPGGTWRTRSARAERRRHRSPRERDCRAAHRRRLARVRSSRGGPG